MGTRLAGKRALVTAAGRGIGRAIAEAFEAEGAEVIATDLDASKLEGLAGARLESLDVTDGSSIRALMDEVGSIDVLANVAGFVHHGTVLDCDDEAWDFSYELNVKSMHRMVRACLPGMLERTIRCMDFTLSS